VITDSISPPTLTIISPTPRAFTFPIDKNEVSPYASPSSSPFEPDLRTLSISPSVIPSSSISVFATSASLASPTSPTTSSVHKRRKSSVSDLDRRPKKGDDDYIKRPENAFILFRRKCCEERQQAQEESSPLSVSADGPQKKQRQADLSKTISQQWKALPAEERLYWEELAKEKKKEHEQMYPNYVYRPQRTKRKNAKGKRGEYEHDTDGEGNGNISFMIPLAPPMIASSKHGRSASAPTPPPQRQVLQVPMVYSAITAPTSPSLAPMIQRRSSHPEHAQPSQAESFDFFPSNDFIASHQQQQSFQQEAYPNMVNPYHGMFNPQSLQPLQMPEGAVMHPNQMMSPTSSIASCSSGPPSPHEAFTPVHTEPSLLYPDAPQYMQQQAPPMDLQTCVAPQPFDAIQFGFQNYCWGNDGSNGVVQGAWNTGELLLGDEFDVNAIPPIELGIQGGNASDELTPTQQHQQGTTYMPYSPEAFSPEQYGSALHHHDDGSDPFERMFDFDAGLQRC